MRCPHWYNADDLCVAYELGNWPQARVKNKHGRAAWVIARPLGPAFFGRRFKLAWAVFTGRADALFWTEQ
jgi:hypothetical protein